MSVTLLPDLVAPAAPTKKQLIAALEFKLEKARHGMGMPYCAEDVRHYEALLAQARRAQPDDPGVESIEDRLLPLIGEYHEFLEREGLTDLGSADEHLFDPDLTEDQRKWLRHFVWRWSLVTHPEE